MGNGKKKQERKLNSILRFLEQKYTIPQEEILQLIKNKEREKKEQQSHYIPISLFGATPVSSLEAMAIYLREEKKLKFSQMGALLGRNPVALSTTYRNAKKKFPKKCIVSETKYYIPCHLFAPRKLSVLETLVIYLKKEYKLQNKKIADLLNKDPRTIWTVLSRVKIKMKENKK